MLLFYPWRRIRPVKDNKAINDFINDVGTTTARKLREGILSPPKSGRMYGNHRASSANEYPANKTGRLARSIRTIRTRHEVSVGTTAPYGGYLAKGTIHMKARKMSKEALKEALPEARQRIRPFMKWQRS